MKKLLRFFFWVVVLFLVMGALLVYFVYTPAAEVPRLSGKLAKGSLESGGWRRTYWTYVPRGLPRNSPLVVALHGSGQSGAQMRRATGYGFERLADEQGFAVVYPDGFEGYWNGCNRIGDYSANRLNIDDVGFLIQLVDRLSAEIGVDRNRVFAAGVSRGGHLAFRLALEAPTRFRAVAAVAANVPTADNFKCKPAEGGTSSVLIMNGTADPLNPFEGGEVKLLGLFRRGTVRSARESGQLFADLNGITGAPQPREIRGAEGVQAEELLWRKDSGAEVALLALPGGGHGLPQPYARYPRILGPTPKDVNGPAEIWKFFARQGPR